jgi:hypothetical protein
MHFAILVSREDPHCFEQTSDREIRNKYKKDEMKNHKIVELMESGFVARK